MSIAVSALTGSAEKSLEDRIAGLRAIDTDIHNDLPSYAELKPFLAQQWHPWLENGGPGFAARAYANTGSGRMDDAVREEDGLGRRRPRVGRPAADDQVPHRPRRPDRHDDRREHPARPALLQRAGQRLQRVAAGEVGAPVRLLQGLDHRACRRTPRRPRARSIVSATIRAWSRC